VVCSSLKGHVGHTLGASGIIEAVLCVLAMQDGFAPGTLQTQTLDSAMRARHLTQRHALPLRTVMANSFGFGGSNCSLLLGAA
jgi:3-oxoacyl-[acyl-carrier-protein] synthase-1